MPKHPEAHLSGTLLLRTLSNPSAARLSSVTEGRDISGWRKRANEKETTSRILAAWSFRNFSWQEQSQ